MKFYQIKKSSRAAVYRTWIIIQHLRYVNKFSGNDYTKTRYLDLKKSVSKHKKPNKKSYDRIKKSYDFEIIFLRNNYRLNIIICWIRFFFKFYATSAKAFLHVTERELKYDFFEYKHFSIIKMLAVKTSHFWQPFSMNIRIFERTIS